jgi:hypothetical protein
MMGSRASKRKTDEMRSNGDFDVDLDWGVEFGLMIWKMFLRFEATISRVYKRVSQEMPLAPCLSTRAAVFPPFKSPLSTIPNELLYSQKFCLRF